MDACAASNTQVPLVQYLPGFVATLALIMINAIRRCAGGPVSLHCKPSCALGVVAAFTAGVRLV